MHGKAECFVLKRWSLFWSIPGILNKLRALRGKVLAYIHGVSGMNLMDLIPRAFKLAEIWFLFSCLPSFDLLLSNRITLEIYVPPRKI